MLSYYKFSFVKKKAVIVGCGRVGRPLGLMLLSKGMTVSYIDKYTRKTDKIKKIRETDLLVVAVGKRGIVDTNWISNNTVVVDVGIHQVNSKTCGDLVLKDLLVREKNGELNELYRTPVPGGVGPMTVCMLLENTIISWLRHTNNNTTISDRERVVTNNVGIRS